MMESDAPAGMMQAPKREWERTPPYHPFRWFGFVWRRVVHHSDYTDYTEWEYMTARGLARDFLRKKFSTLPFDEQRGRQRTANRMGMK